MEPFAPTKASRQLPNGRRELYKLADFDYARDILPDGTLRAGWEAEHIVRITLPAPLRWLTQTVSLVAVHHVAANDVSAAFHDVHSAGLWHVLSPYGGGFNPRLISGSYNLSLHSFGFAFDFNPPENKRGWPPESTVFGGNPDGLEVVSIMEAHGWYWGGRFATIPDAMHFQFATGC